MFSSLWTNAKQRWWQSQEVKLREEFAPRIQALQATLKAEEDTLALQQQEVHERQQALTRQQQDVEDLIQRTNDRKAELVQVNEDLKQQIRLIEAKASPDAVWVEAFSRGYEKAWETMWPLLSSGVQKSREAIYQAAVDETLRNLDATVVQRAEALGHMQARTIQELQGKRAEFQQKRAMAKDAMSQAKYDHYLEALHWMLQNGDHLLQNPARAV